MESHLQLSVFWRICIEWMFFFLPVSFSFQIILRNHNCSPDSDFKFTFLNHLKNGLYGCWQTTSLYHLFWHHDWQKTRRKNRLFSLQWSSAKNRREFSCVMDDKRFFFLGLIKINRCFVYWRKGRQWGLREGSLLQRIGFPSSNQGVSPHRTSKLRKEYVQI